MMTGSLPYERTSGQGNNEEFHSKLCKRGDLDVWTSEAGGIRVVINKKSMSDIFVKEMHHAAKIEAPYIIEN
ncbi:MAG: hypothetical protein ABI856_14120 [Nitrospira sp.]